jgi:hypothetical protein
MQLDIHRSESGAAMAIGSSLAAATCALLGTSAGSLVVAQELEPWEIDSAVLMYGEADGRVQDLSVKALARKEIKEEHFLNLSLALDTLTGATPNGAVASSVPQTFTRPSGNDSYTIAPNEQPLDPTFQDSRVALGANWQMPLTRLTLLDVGASFSDEYDYTHVGLNGRIARDFNDRNTTVSLGLALASDSLNPVGGAPLPLSAMGREREGDGDDDYDERAQDLSKDVLDVLLGLTQVIDRHTLVQLNYSLSRSDGYLNDPYKLLSVIDPETGLPSVNPGEPSLNLYLYENRPDTREKQSVFALLKRDFSGNVLDASYRYMTDDWEIQSHTVDVRYRWKLNDTSYLQPHLRFYTQTAADFYQTVLFDGAALPTYATADYRLGAFDAITVGLGYGRETSVGEWSARLELYQQTGSASAGARVGDLLNQDLYPDLNAIIAQVGFKFGR